ncbi:hypothetical protein KW798_02825 [Candidatus Parcubacteria bacterium]|nr:hypothetical protein [Candidatus Parcubacteria bacterium]
MRTSTFVWIVVVVVIILGVGWYVYSMPQTTPETQTQTNNNPNGPDYTPPTTDTNTSGATASSSSSSSTSAPMNVTVTHGPNGFSPAEVTVKKGGTVTWQNSGSGGMWVASAQHPTHTVYSGTSLQQHCPDTTHTAFDQCAAGTSFSFTFDKVGTWAYHNHANSSQFGHVTVVE